MLRTGAKVVIGGVGLGIYTLTYHYLIKPLRQTWLAHRGLIHRSYLIDTNLWAVIDTKPLEVWRHVFSLAIVNVYQNVDAKFGTLGSFSLPEGALRAQEWASSLPPESAELARLVELSVSPYRTMFGQAVGCGCAGVFGLGMIAWAVVL